MPPFNLSSPDNSITQKAELRFGANLPHLSAPHGIYAVTFRLGDSLPQTCLKSLQLKREQLLNSRTSQAPETSICQEAFLPNITFDPAEKFLDSGFGMCWMKRPAIAQLVEDALKKFDGERYDLICWCVMPNHVHVVLFPYPDHLLSTIEHSWKSFTSKMANKLLHRTGQFWQQESYDRLIRDTEELERALNYICANPAKAGLRDWKWVGMSPRIGEILENIARIREQDK